MSTSWLQDAEGANPLGGLADGSPWDAVVVGAGPAGSLAALELSRRGRRVLLLEREVFPRWKVCGATLSPGAQEELRRAGLDALIEEAGARPLRVIRLGGWGSQVELPLSGSVALSRARLDQVLARAAQEAGVVVRFGVGVRLGPVLQDRRVLDVRWGARMEEISARVVVAADGLTSGLMSQAGIPSQPISGARRALIGLGASLPSAHPAFEEGVVHMSVGEAGYVGAVRVEDGSLNVAAALTPASIQRSGGAHALPASLLKGDGWPLLLEDVGVTWKGTPRLARSPAAPGAERLLAVGDAGGYLEPFTGEGMFWALAGARLLAPLAAGVSQTWDPGILETWTRLHRRQTRRAQRHCRTISWALARPAVTRGVLRILSHAPELAGPVIRRVGAPLAPPTVEAPCS